MQKNKSKTNQYNAILPGGLERSYQQRTCCNQAEQLVAVLPTDMLLEYKRGIISWFVKYTNNTRHSSSWGAYLPHRLHVEGRRWHSALRRRPDQPCQATPWGRTQSAVHSVMWIKLTTKVSTIENKIKPIKLVNEPSPYQHVHRMKLQDSQDGAQFSGHCCRGFRQWMPRWTGSEQILYLRRSRSYFHPKLQTALIQPICGQQNK